MLAGLKREAREVVGMGGERAVPMSAANQVVPAALAAPRRPQRVVIPRLVAGRAALGVGLDNSAHSQ